MEPLTFKILTKYQKDSNEVEGKADGERVRTGYSHCTYIYKTQNCNDQRNREGSDQYF